jgi:hypothetical protein
MAYITDQWIILPSTNGISLNKKKCLCIHQKFKLVISYNVVKKNVKVSKQFNLLSCTLSTLWKNKETFLSEF